MVKDKNFEKKHCFSGRNWQTFLIIIEVYFLQNKRDFEDTRFKYWHHYFGKKVVKGVKFILLGVLRYSNRIFVNFTSTIPKKFNFIPYIIFPTRMMLIFETSILKNPLVPSILRKMKFFIIKTVCQFLSNIKKPFFQISWL